MSISENRKIMIAEYLKESDLERAEIISKCIDQDDFDTFCSLYNFSKKDILLTIGLLIEDSLI